LLSEAGHDIPPLTLASRLDQINAAPGAALVAVEWGPPSGLVVVHWYQTLDADRPRAQITTLLVGPAQRRRGIARLLVKAAAQAARVAGCGELELLAGSDAPALAEFCRATGFTEAGLSFARPLRKKG
jgi:aminoglycoside 6'-N-acetyltransferase I